MITHLDPLYIYLFADDPKVFREICSVNELECLQSDTVCMEKWSDT